jgi:uncharacterized membrane protein YdbT with pleckstrin-like domain
MSDDAQPQPEPTGEPIHYQGRLHWTIYVRPVMLTCIALTIFKYGEPLVGAAFALAAGLFWAAALMAVAGSALLITDRRVRLSSGAVYRVTLELPLDEVDSVSVRQDMMGRLLGYGTLVVDSSGGARASCPNVARPAEFRRQLQALAELG